MHIHQINIHGFKSYANQTHIEPFSPKHNVIVGRNGSGKSNFFSAIRFVLGDDYNHLSQKERSKLLHEGSGSAVMTAYVEVVFDNSDNRFPTGNDKLTLRRSIGNKKDEYSIDHKNSTKKDVESMLEVAGFSRANPYYIVKQGMVTELTNKSDQARLELLKDVAGTKVYDERRRESLRIMQETDNKRNKIDELLNGIEGRLQELEQEKEALTVYQNKDRERRALQYTIENRELIKNQKKLDALENSRQERRDLEEEHDAEYRQREEELDALDMAIQENRQRIELLNAEKLQDKSEWEEYMKQKGTLESDVAEIAEGQDREERKRPS
ncbi:RecF/RecN/SMC protein [Lophium mytilinum]|uniref:RecF/RecN/SMC protein n=1 Tax=Lophium mytilinum TaxID=390894 RepID=A0A6A6QJM6_9PEZI|nr:RecF/RecN/SMC protein [Lophium mytilinum]